MRSPGHSRANSDTRSLASSRSAACSTKCRLQSPLTLKMRKGRGIQAPDGDELQGGQWGDYRINLVCWITESCEAGLRGDALQAPDIPPPFSPSWVWLMER